MGAWQGFWVTRVGVSSFIVTLAGMLYFRGISMIVTNGATVAPLPRSLTGFATGFLPPAWSIAAIVARARRLCARCGLPRSAGRRRSACHRQMRGRTLLRALAPPAIAAVVAIWIVSLAGHSLSRPAGRPLRPRGRVRHAPHPLRRAALRDRRQPGGGAALRHQPRRASIFWNFVIAGLGYGITGVALTARVSGAIGGSAGLFLELDAIAAAIIGGTSLVGRARPRPRRAARRAADGQPQQRHEPDERPDLLPGHRARRRAAARRRHRPAQPAAIRRGAVAFAFRNAAEALRRRLMTWNEIDQRDKRRLRKSLSGCHNRSIVSPAIPHLSPTRNGRET